MPTTRWCLILGALTGLFWVAMAFRPVAAAVTRGDLAVVRVLAGARSGPLTEVMRVAAGLGSMATVRVLAWATIAVLLVARRVRHLLVYLALLLGWSLGLTAVAASLGRMRPAGVRILAGWDGYALPSRPVAMLGVVLVGAVSTLVPGARPRTMVAMAGIALVLALGVARVYLGVDHPTDVLTGLAAGWAVPLAVFRLVTPDEAFPVRYRRGRAAHLDVGGRRGDAIVRALDQQLDITAVAIEPFGLGGSAGSTPLRIRVVRPDGAEGVLFGKLYAVNHLRADRWYKLARTIRYGRLEDEKPFSTVRRLVEYEDHMLRLMRDAGLPTPAPYGFVEITPEREYVIAMEFFEGAQEIGSVDAGDVDDQVVDDALAIVRRLWDAGLAHRDIKPSNVLVGDGHVYLIDVAFAAVRPTPWRQAVDLANTMLTLSLVIPPARVYRRALAFFAPVDIAEAFAASRSVTVPTQLRNRLRAERRDAVEEFRRLAPDRRPVSIQLWSVRRAALTAAVFLTAVTATGGLVAYLHLAGLL